MALSITTMTFDKSVYNTGDPITLTVEYTSDDAAPAGQVTSAVTAVLSDSAGTTSDSASFSVNSEAMPLPTTVSASDNRATPGTWTVVSNSFAAGAGPTWNGTAVLTSVA